jgi:hypothetical protein
MDFLCSQNRIMTMGNGNLNICWQTELCPVDCPVNQSIELLVFFLSFGWIVVVLVTKILVTSQEKSKVVSGCHCLCCLPSLCKPWWWGVWVWCVLPFIFRHCSAYPVLFAEWPKICHHKQTCSNAPKRKSKDIRLVQFSQTCSNQKSSEIQVYLFKHPINADQTHLHFVSPDKSRPANHPPVFV